MTACTADLADAHLPTPTAIGIAVGGHIVDDTIVTFAPFLHWEGRIPFAALVEQATGLPTRLYNDIDSLLVDACWFGGPASAIRWPSTARRSTTPTRHTVWPDIS